MQRRVWIAPIFLAATAGFLVAGRAADPQRPAEGERSSRTAQEEEKPGRSGIVVDWRLHKDGTLYLLLEESPLGAGENGPLEAGAATGEVTRTWFKSPPIQGDQVHFKDLALMAVLQTHQRGSSMLRVTLWTDTEAARPDVTRGGKTRDDALTFAMIGPG